MGGKKMHLEWIFSYGKMSWVCVWWCFVSRIIWRKPGTYACDSCLWTWLPLRLHVSGTLHLLLQSTCHWGRNQCGLAVDLTEWRTKGGKNGTLKQSKCFWKHWGFFRPSIEVLLTLATSPSVARKGKPLMWTKWPLWNPGPQSFWPL